MDESQVAGSDVEGAGQNDRVSGATLAGVGCVTAFAGGFAGGMIAVTIGKFVGWLQHCQAETGTPACNWHWYMFAGFAVGMVLLPSISIWRLKGRR